MSKEKNEYYTEGFFSTKINEKKIGKYKDVIDWLKKMCELAKKSTRHFWGTKKNQNVGMSGLLNVCEKFGLFSKCNDLNGYGILGKVGIVQYWLMRSLLESINNIYLKTQHSRMNQENFYKTLSNAIEYINKKIKDTYMTLFKYLDTKFTSCKNYDEIKSKLKKFVPPKTFDTDYNKTIKSIENFRENFQASIQNLKNYY